MRRRIPFLVFVLSLLFGGTTYIAARLATHEAHVAIVAALLTLPLLFFFLPRRSSKEPTTKLGKVVQQAGFVALGLLSWLAVVAGIRDLVLLGLGALASPDVLDRTRTATAGTPAFLAALGISALGAFWALRGPRIRSVTVPIDGLPPSLAGFRIVQISDLHVGPTIGPRYVDKLVRQVATLEPHVTALTGDIFDGKVADLSHSAASLSRLAPNGRVFYVPGNHEYYHSFDSWEPELARLGFRTLLNRGEALEHGGETVWIGGVPDPAGGFPDPSLAARGADRAAFRVLLSHRPAYTEEASRAGFHLQLSGHTHGGQFFPWTIVVGWFHRYFVGLLRAERMWIYVSPGTGTWGPPIRLGTTPEVTCLELRSA
jgi:predicted MPP superfamily phosphohydrolase